MKKEIKISELDENGKGVKKNKYTRRDNFTNSQGIMKVKTTEHEKLKKFASKITIIPKTINIPTEYLGAFEAGN